MVRGGVNCGQPKGVKLGISCLFFYKNVKINENFVTNFAEIFKFGNAFEDISDNWIQPRFLESEYV